MGGHGKIGQRSSSLFMLLFLLSIFELLSSFGTTAVAAFTYPTEPVKIPPIVTVQSPQQGTYTSSNVTLKFSVNAPESWYKDGAPLVFFRNVTYQVDSNAPVLIWTTGRSYANITPGELTHNIAGLGRGSHTILINVTISSVYDIFGSGDPHGHFSKEDIWNATKTISFNIGTAPSTAETSTPKPTPSPSVPEFPWFTILPLLTIMLVAVLFLKHRQVKKT